MRLRRFAEVSGQYIAKIYGQDRFAFAQSDSSDFYDLIEWAKRGAYPGSVLSFYDFATGAVYRPFEKRENILYSDPVYAGGRFYFLQGDYAAGRARLFCCLPGEMLDCVAEFDLGEMALYNLRLVGDPVHLVSEQDEVRCYYPTPFRFAPGENESVQFIRDGKVYLEAWVEEGWDDAQDRATEAYRMYYETIVRDFSGRELSREVGGLYQAADGDWWMA